MARSAPSHYLNQWWNIVNSNLNVNKILSKIHRFSFKKMNAYENVVCEMGAILSQWDIKSISKRTFHTLSSHIYPCIRLKKTHQTIFVIVWHRSRKLSQSQRNTWWRHQMETFSASLAICAGNSPVPCEFPAQRPVTRSFDVFFDLRLNKRLSKQSWGWWFETLSRPLWRHRNDITAQK